MTTKRILLTGSATRHGITINYVKPRQETLHRCPVCLHMVARRDMLIIDGIFVCVTCAGDAQDESEEE